MTTIRRAALQDLLGGRLVYRQLRPIDPSLPRFEDLAQALALPLKPHPRKGGDAYAKYIVALLAHCQASRKAQPLDALIYIGDTAFNDGRTFQTLCDAGALIGAALIVSEDLKAPPVLRTPMSNQSQLYFANRWRLIDRFENRLHKSAIPVSERTAVILDVDKTLIGARGRNDHLINQARLTAALTFAQNTLAEPALLDSFKICCRHLDQPVFHTFTGDNQDNVIYICLMAQSLALSIQSLQQDINQGTFRTIQDFIQWVTQHQSQLPSTLFRLHQEFKAAVEAGDPTPLKPFRYQEYVETLKQMQNPLTAKDQNTILNQQLSITGEVYDRADEWQKKGALLLGLSDKPDEACFPPDGSDPKQRPLHAIPLPVIKG